MCPWLSAHSQALGVPWPGKSMQCDFQSNGEVAIFRAYRFVRVIVGLYLSGICAISQAEGVHVFSDTATLGISQVSAGKLAPMQVAVRKGVKPVFVIGIDTDSVRWLRQNKNYFRKINAVGLVIDPVTQGQLRQLRKMTGFRLLFAQPNSTSLLKEFEILYYPVLIDVSRGVITQ